MINIKKITAKSILTKSNLPGIDWVVNPYVGCQFACQYCYATFIGKWKHPGEEWGNFIDIKINAPELLRAALHQLQKRRGGKNFGSIFFSSVTDPYTGIESKYQITRKCLNELVRFGYTGHISILTKSPLVTRDIDLFTRLNSEVGMTVTTLDDDISAFFEVRAPAASSRIAALRKLHEEGIDTYAFVGPLLPYIAEEKERLRELFLILKNVGVDKAYVEHLNLSPAIKKRLYHYLARNNPAYIPLIEKMATPAHRRELNIFIKEVLDATGITLLGGNIITHAQ